MNVNRTPNLSIPFFNGLFISAAPGHEKSLELAIPHLSLVVNALNRYHYSPLLSEYLDTVLSRFLRSNDYSAKNEYMLRVRIPR